MMHLQKVLPTRLFSYAKEALSAPWTLNRKVSVRSQSSPPVVVPGVLTVDVYQQLSRKIDDNPQPVPSAAPLRVVRPRRKLMSYNAEQFYRSRKGHDVKPLASIQALADAILLEEPDVIALQEVGDRRLLQDFNTRYLGGQYPNIVSIPVLNGGPLRVAMMSKANIKVVGAKSHWQEMNLGATYEGKRDFLETTFETETGYRFTVYNAHCHSMRGGEAATTPIRLQEVSNAAKVLKAHLQADKKAQVFVAGDFNALPDTEYGQAVLGKLTHFADDKEKPDLIEVMMKDGKAEPTHNGHGHYPDSKLDYIFVSRPMVKQVVNAYVAGQFDEAPWKIASDHVPYVTVFEETAPVAKRAKASKEAKKPAVQPPVKKQKINMIA